MHLLLLSTIFTAILLIPSARCGVAEAETKWLDMINKVNKNIKPENGENPDISFFDVPANISGSPVLVTVSLHILDISEIDDDDQDFKVNLYLRQSWNDPRFIHTPSDASLEFVTTTGDEHSWMPDLFFVNERSGSMHDITKKNTFTRFYGNGDVLHSSRYSVKLSCPMDHSRFPFDKQICGFSLESYGYTLDNIVFLWKDNNNSVTVGTDIKPKPFELQGYGYGYCNKKVNDFEYSCIRTEVLLARRGSARYVLQAYIPLGALVLLSYGLLWCPGHRCKRLALAGVLFVLVSGVAAISTTLAPDTSDCTALECWAWWSVLLSSLPMIILALAATMDCCRRNAQKRDYESCAEDGNKTMELLAPKFTENGDGATEETPGPAPALKKKQCMFAKVGLTVERFEKCARMFLLILLGLYVLAHVLYYAIDMTCHMALSVEKKFPFTN